MEKFGQTQRSLFQNERSSRKTGSSLAKLREVTPVFLILEEVYIKMRVFIKTERILRKTGRSLDKHREVYLKMREVSEKLGELRDNLREVTTVRENFEIKYEVSTLVLDVGSSQIR